MSRGVRLAKTVRGVAACVRKGNIIRWCLEPEDERTRNERGVQQGQTKQRPQVECSLPRAHLPPQFAISARVTLIQGVAGRGGVHRVLAHCDPPRRVLYQSNAGEGVLGLLQLVDPIVDHNLRQVWDVRVWQMSWSPSSQQQSFQAYDDAGIDPKQLSLGTQQEEG